MTVPYYLFTDAGIEVDLASPLGGEIAIDPMSLRAVTRSHHDDRFLVDDLLKEKVRKSISMSDIDVEIYDVIYFAGGWGASFDLGFSDIVGQKVTEANAKGTILSGVCHGPLGFLRASNLQGRPLVEGRRITGVTDKQVLELGIDATPHHPETELRKLGADFKCSHRFRDPFANHWEVDENLVRAMLGIADRSKILKVLHFIIQGDQKKSIEQLKELIDQGLDPANFLNTAVYGKSKVILL